MTCKKRLYQYYFIFFQNNNITEVNVDTFCRSNDTYYLRPSLNEVRLDGNPVVLSKYPDNFTCMKVLPVGKYRWGDWNLTVLPLLLMEVFPQQRAGRHHGILDLWSWSHRCQRFYFGKPTISMYQVKIKPLTGLKVFINSPKGLLLTGGQ